ncbi:MAG TPA: hypothetical protein VGR02_03580 [Thermoanaerobaculia bacterium]|nr:hypothetical protein [Thermoanaerobaculia bacterium]
MRRLAAILVTLTLLLPAAALFAAKPLPCCCKSKQACPLKKQCGCSLSRTMPHPAPASIPFQARWTIETPFTLAVPLTRRAYPAPPAQHAVRLADAPNTPPPRLS